MGLTTLHQRSSSESGPAEPGTLATAGILITEASIRHSRMRRLLSRIMVGALSATAAGANVCHRNDLQPMSWSRSQGCSL